MTVRSDDCLALQNNLQGRFFFFFTIDNELCMTYNLLCKRLHDFAREVDEDGSHNQ